jgi:hypothetical protein
VAADAGGFVHRVERGFEVLSAAADDFNDLRTTDAPIHLTLVDGGDDKLPLLSFGQLTQALEKCPVVFVRRLS